MVPSILKGIPPMTQDSIGKVRQFEQSLLVQGTNTLHTHHTVHGGVYTRTILLKKGEVLCGALIKVPTTLIITGHLVVYIGTEFSVINGYNVLPASANRKQLMIAIEDTHITMCLQTNNRTLDGIEKEFTDEYSLLLSSLDPTLNTIIIGD